MRKRLESENIKLSQKKDDVKLHEMLNEMDVEIVKQKRIEQQQKEERKRKVEEDLQRKIAGNRIVVQSHIHTDI